MSTTNTTTETGQARERERQSEAAELYRLEIVAQHMMDLIRDAYRKLVTVEELIRIERLDAKSGPVPEFFRQYPDCERALRAFVSEMLAVETPPVDIAGRAASELCSQLNEAAFHVDSHGLEARDDG